MHEETRNFLIQALEAYSAVIYQALCLFAYLHDKYPEAYTEDEINNVLFSETQKLPINNDLTIDADFMFEIEKKADAYTTKHMAGIVDHEDFKQFLTVLVEKGMNNKTAYLFVEAHCFFNSILIPSLDKIRYKCKLNDIQHVKNTYNPKVVINKINNVVNHYEDHLHIKSIVYQCESYIQNHTWQKITQKLLSLMC